MFGPSDAKSHRCPPEWEARIEDLHGDDWTIVKGVYDAENAAEQLARSCDGERDLLGCDIGWLVEVRKPGDESTVERFRVHASASIDYSATAEVLR